MKDDPEGTNAQLLANALSRAEKAEDDLRAEILHSAKMREQRDHWKARYGSLSNAMNDHRSIIRDLAEVERPADADDRPCDDTWEDANLLWDLADRARALLECANA